MESTSCSGRRSHQRPPSKRNAGRRFIARAGNREARWVPAEMRWVCCRAHWPSHGSPRLLLHDCAMTCCRPPLLQAHVVSFVILLLASSATHSDSGQLYGMATPSPCQLSITSAITSAEAAWQAQAVLQQVRCSVSSATVSLPVTSHCMRHVASPSCVQVHRCRGHLGQSATAPTTHQLDRCPRAWAPALGTVMVFSAPGTLS